MKKIRFYAFLVATMVAAFGFGIVGCTDDDEETDDKKYDENGEVITDNPDGDIDIKEKRIARIWVKDESEYNGEILTTYDCLGFKYDDEGRIKKMMFYHCEEDGTVNEDDCTTYTIRYDATKVTMCNDGTKNEDEWFKLEEGRVVEKEDYMGTVYYYRYDYGYISRITTDFGLGFVFWDDLSVGSDGWTDASRTSAVEDSDDYGVNFEMSDIENNTNLNLWICSYPFGSINETSNDVECLLALTGKRGKYLPERINYRKNFIAEPTSTEEFEYTMNDEGYVTQIVIRLDVPNVGTVETDVWKITYEE